MKICAACHKDLPKESYSKKQWKLERRKCKVCVTNNREVQPIPKQDNNDSNTNEIIKSLDSINLEDVKNISDEELFKQPPPLEDCPICFLLLPVIDTGRKYQSCCGKRICSGCAYAPVYDNQGNKVDNEKCPFCRTPAPTSEENIKMLEKRVEKDDPIAIHNIGYYYSEGLKGFPQDYVKALELYHRAAKLDIAGAYTNIGYAYNNGEGVEVDKKKATHYYELAAIKGDVTARYNLGLQEENSGNMDRALKHYMIAVRSGDNDSLDRIKELYSNGHATKEDYTNALRLYQAYVDEIKSPQRDKAAAFNDLSRYY